MEYKLLKTIEPNLSLTVPNEMMPRLSAYPANDFVNPGLGQISRLYSFYVPLHARSLHSETKTEPNVSAVTQQGGGNFETEGDEQDTVKDGNIKLKSFVQIVLKWP